MKKILVVGLIALLPFLLTGCDEESGPGTVYYEDYYILEGHILSIEADIERARHFFDHVRNNNIAGVIEELEAGFNAEIADTEEGTALLVASAYGYKEMVLVLLEVYAANIYAETDEGLTALMLASEQGHVEIAEILIFAGAYVDALNEDGKNALMMAVENGEADVAHLLSHVTLYLEALDPEGRTAEAIAELYGHLDILAMLVEERLSRL